MILILKFHLPLNFCILSCKIWNLLIIYTLKTIIVLSQFTISQTQRRRPLEHAITLMSPVTGVLYYMLLPCLMVFVFIICQMCNEITI